MTPLLVLIYISSFFGIFTSLMILLTLYEHRREFEDPKPKRLPFVSVIVPAFNEQGRIKRTVDSLLNLNYPKEKLEIFLIDDGSTDNTWKEMQSFNSPQIKAFTKKNSGKASCLNFGIAKAKGEIIISLDADSFVDKQALMKMIGYFNDQDCMAVAPTMKVHKPKTILQKVQYVEYLFGALLRKASSFMDCVHVTPGPFTAYRKSFFEKHGGYAEGNLTEDLEIAMRIQSHNYKIYSTTDAFVYTPGPSKFNSLFRQRTRWYLGFLDNMWDYRRMLSPRYGSFGLYFLPAALISVALTLSLFIWTAKVMLVNVKDTLFNLKSVNFDIIQVLMNIRADLFYLTPGLIATISIATLVLGTVIILLARHLSARKDSFAVPFVLSTLFYGPLYASWWIGTLLFKATGRKMRWSGVVWKKD